MSPDSNMNREDQLPEKDNKTRSRPFVAKGSRINAISILMILLLMVGIASLALEAYAFYKDVMWNGVVKGEGVLPANSKCRYFDSRTFALNTSDAIQGELMSDLLRESHLDHVFMFSLSIFILINFIYLCIYLKMVDARSSGSWMIAWFLLSGFFNIINGCLLITVLESSYKDQYIDAIKHITTYEQRFYKINVKNNSMEETIEIEPGNITQSRAVRLHEQAFGLRKILKICGAVPPTLSAKHFPDILSGKQFDVPDTITIKGLTCLTVELEAMGFCQDSQMKFCAIALTMAMALICWIICCIACCSSQREDDFGFAEATPIPAEATPVVFGTNKDFQQSTKDNNNSDPWAWDNSPCNPFSAHYDASAYKDESSSYDPRYPPVDPSITNATKLDRNTYNGNDEGQEFDTPKKKCK